MKKVIKDKDGRVTKVVTVFTKPTKTQQQFKDQCDVNKIIKKYQKTGELDHLKKSQGVFADLTYVGDYQESLNKVIQANKSFSELNSQTRNRFRNDPQQLIEFLSDPKNEKEAIELGLIVPKEIPQVPVEKPDQSTGGKKE